MNWVNSWCFQGIQPGFEYILSKQKSHTFFWFFFLFDLKVNCVYRVHCRHYDTLGVVDCKMYVAHAQDLWSFSNLGSGPFNNFVQNVSWILHRGSIIVPIKIHRHLWLKGGKKNLVNIANPICTMTEHYPFHYKHHFRLYFVRFCICHMQDARMSFICNESSYLLWVILAFVSWISCLFCRPLNISCDLQRMQDLKRKKDNIHIYQHHKHMLHIQLISFVSSATEMHLCLYLWKFLLTQIWGMHSLLLI